MRYEAVIGLEVHAQMLTDTKIFCGCSTKFGSEPNTQTCQICIGMPGVLPVLNRKALEFAVRTGLATHCTISSYSRFARKNYFYPDLPKGYQISQYESPICERGYLEILVDGEVRKIGITWPSQRAPPRSSGGREDRGPPVPWRACPRWRQSR